MIARVIVAGGGTGGHLFPGIAVVEELRRRDPSLEVLFVGTARGIETRVVPALGETLACIDVAPLKGGSSKQWLTGISGLPRAGLQALAIMRRFRPDLVLGVGGYAAGPMVLAARALGVRTALLEQNARAGLTNRLLSRVVERAYLSFEETRSQFPAASARVVGNPVRRTFVTAGHLARMDPAGLEMRARSILVVGGSQGARALNETVPEALAEAGVAGSGLTIVHQAGHAMGDAVRARYAALGLTATVTPFIDDMARAYASAAVVISRAGATSLSEICAVGRPSILIPFPFAADDHQWFNASALVERGAAFALREAELTVSGLAGTVRTLVSDPQKRREMAEAARDLGRPEAAAAIVDDLVASLDGSPHVGTRDPGDQEAEGERSEPELQRSLAGRSQLRSPRRGRARSVAWSRADPYYGARPMAALPMAAWGVE